MPPEDERVMSRRITAAVTARQPPSDLTLPSINRAAQVPHIVTAIAQPAASSGFAPEQEPGDQPPQLATQRHDTYQQKAPYRRSGRLGVTPGGHRQCTASRHFSAPLFPSSSF